MELSKGKTIMSFTSTLNYKYCGRNFSKDEIQWINHLIQSNPHFHRVALSRKVCEKFSWFKADGGLKEMSCRVAMIRMEKDGLISLPAPRRKYIPVTSVKITTRSNSCDEIITPLKSILPLKILKVDNKNQSSLWNELIHRYHYLGYKKLPGAQIRYIIYSNNYSLLAALGFGASAWLAAPRDKWIGWSDSSRKKNLHLIVNNARFLILPWVKVKYLASHILSMIAKRLPNDWLSVYNYSPVLLETFVEKDRFYGTSYKAANWVYVGQTKGRGKLEKKCIQVLPFKDIYLYPLHKNFRKFLN